MWATSPRKKSNESHQTDELAEQLLDTEKSERPKEHVLKTPKKPAPKTRTRRRSSARNPTRPREVVPNPHSSLPLAQVSGRLRGIANGGNVDGVLVPLIEEHAGVATARVLTTVDAHGKQSMAMWYRDDAMMAPFPFALCRSCGKTIERPSGSRVIKDVMTPYRGRQRRLPCGGAIRSASQLCRFLHVAPVICPTSVRSQDP